MFKVSIIWWTNWFWKWLARYLLNNFWNDISLTITWINIEKWNKVANKIWAKFSNDNIYSASDSDIVIFSVPIWIMVDTIKTVWPHIKKWTIVLDVTSIKKQIVDAFEKYLDKDVIVIPTHPMFWPYISSIWWQIFVFTPSEKIKSNTNYINIKKYLDKNWAKVIESTPEEHDKNMAIVQLITHFDMFVLWETIKKMWVDIKKTLSFVSPIYKILISSVSRYMYQDPKLYSDIQMHNTEILNVHEAFTSSAIDINNNIKEKDEDWFINRVNEIWKYFWDNWEAWQLYTDKIIYMLWKQVDNIKNSIWKKVKLVNIYSWNEVIWTVKWFENDVISFDNWEEYDINKYDVNII